MTNGDLWFFERFAGPYAWLMPRADPAPLQRALASAERPIDRVVDVAGGTGRAVRAVNAPERLVFDAAAGMLARVDSAVGVVRGDAASLPLGNETVDAVLIVDALHHLPSVDDAMDEAHRILRPGGVLVIREFDRATLRGRFVEFVEHVVGFDSTFFTPDSLAARIATIGFDATVEDRGFACTVVGVKTKPG